MGGRSLAGAFRDGRRLNRGARNSGSGPWALELAGPGATVYTEMLTALWSGQESRHGGNGYRKPSVGEAEAAVLLAVPLVHWFTSGALIRR